MSEGPLRARTVRFNPPTDGWVYVLPITFVPVFVPATVEPEPQRLCNGSAVSVELVEPDGTLRWSPSSLLCAAVSREEFAEMQRVLAKELPQ